MIEIDGSHGEGGGSIVRVALALSCLTMKPFEVKDIRKGRHNPGLKRQHLSIVKALKDLTDAYVEGDHLGSKKLLFRPQKVGHSNLKVDLETAGSISLFLQGILPYIVLSNERTTIEVTGGTDVKWSIPIDYVREVFLPQLRRFADFDLSILKRGYYPKGQGKVKLSITPKKNMNLMEVLKNKPFVHKEQGELMRIAGVSHASKSLMTQNVAERQARAAEFILKQLNTGVDIRVEYCDSESVGSGICLWGHFTTHDELDATNPIILGSDALGERGKRAEIIGQSAARDLLRYMELGVPVDSNLSDQLLVYMGFSPGSSIRTSEITDHVKSNIYVIEQFLDSRFSLTKYTISTREKRIDEI